MAGRESGHDRITEAINELEAALEVIDSSSTPRNWAVTENLLGNAYFLLSIRTNDTLTMERAITTYQKALEVQTAERSPLSRAYILYNLGNALQAIGQSLEAIAAYNEALQYRNCDTHHRLWDNITEKIESISSVSSDNTPRFEGSDSVQISLGSFTPTEDGCPQLEDSNNDLEPATLAEQ